MIIPTQQTHVSQQVVRSSEDASPSAPSVSDHQSSKYLNIGTVCGALMAIVLIPCIAFIVYRIRKAWKEEEGSEDELPELPGMPRRFSYRDLAAATGDFSSNLGSGGFGCVFEGALGDGTLIAVKRLENVGNGRSEFLAEVETIGSTHHLNLVKLIGFCAERTHRLLVYEYMSNGSLDRWIFGDGESSQRIPWETRRKIIRDVASGLTYLHEECERKIAHLDIKPQNILLDAGFNAKISDFGLARLIERDESGVVTTLRGTPGYIAPEWLHSAITEKADVYSFGVVVMEMVCGRRNLDGDRPEESMHLLSLLKEKAGRGELAEVLEEMQCGGAEMEGMVKLAMWCSVSDPSRRPAMSMVVKALQGVIEITEDLYCEVAGKLVMFETGMGSDGSTPLFSSFSGRS